MCLNEYLWSKGLRMVGEYGPRSIWQCKKKKPRNKVNTLCTRLFKINTYMYTHLTNHNVPSGKKGGNEVHVTVLRIRPFYRPFLINTCTI